jgi:hypothetical protein
VNALVTRKGNKGFLSGGNDGIVCIWDEVLARKLNVIDMRSNVQQVVNPKIRAICEDSNGDISIGTRGGEIFEYKGDGTSVCLVKSHFSKQLWGLAAYANKPEYLTFGED